MDRRAPRRAATPEKVEAALAATGRAPDEVVCSYAERQRDVTVEHVAINAVMAGCRPELYLIHI